MKTAGPAHGISRQLGRISHGIPVRAYGSGQNRKNPGPGTNGKVTLENIKAKTAYVVYKGEAAKEPDVDYGEGGYVQDPGFNYGDLRCWTVDCSEASVKKE